MSLLLSLLCLARGARAQVAAEQPAARAIELGRSALAHYDEGRLPEALEDLAAAEQYMYSPVFSLYRARCHRGIYFYQLALRELRELAAAPLPPNAPPPFVEARRAAAIEAEELSTQIPTLYVEPQGAATLEVDDAPLPVGVHLALDPGLHVVRLRLGARLLLEHTLQLRPGEQRKLVKSPSSPKPRPSAPSLALRPQRERAASWTPRERAAAVAFGFGTVGVAVGLVTGLLAWNDRAHLSCRGSTCDDADRERGERGRKLANVSTAAFVIGASGWVAGGLVLSVLPPRGAEREVVLSARGEF